MVLASLREDISPAIKGERKIYYEDGFKRVSTYDGPRMGHGNKLAGPAIIEEPNSTIFITPDFQLTCDKFSNYLIHPKGISLEETISRLKK